MTRKSIAIFMFSLVIVMVSAFSAQATDEGPPPPSWPEGCTPGYWKNHQEAWVGYTPDDHLASVFGESALYGLGEKTLLEALQFKGGPGVTGAARILLRQAVAGLLNLVHPDVNYFLDDYLSFYLNRIDSSLATADRTKMLIDAGTVEGMNDLFCPLGNTPDIQ